MSFRSFSLSLCLLISFSPHNTKTADPITASVIYAGGSWLAAHAFPLAVAALGGGVAYSAISSASKNNAPPTQTTPAIPSSAHNSSPAYAPRGNEGGYVPAPNLVATSPVVRQLEEDGRRYDAMRAEAEKAIADGTAKPVTPDPASVMAKNREELKKSYTWYDRNALDLLKAKLKGASDAEIQNRHTSLKNLKSKIIRLEQITGIKREIPAPTLSESIKKRILLDESPLILIQANKKPKSPIPQFMGNGGPGNSKKPKKDDDKEKLRESIQGAKEVADEVKRKVNKLSKTEAMNKIKENYRYDNQSRKYILKENGTPIKCTRTGKDVYGIDWDGAHIDMEAYRETGHHMGSIDAEDFRMYKGPVAGRKVKL